jgi:hypothetical protein
VVTTLLYPSFEYVTTLVQVSGNEGRKFGSLQEEEEEEEEAVVK